MDLMALMREYCCTLINSSFTSGVLFKMYSSLWFLLNIDSLSLHLHRSLLYSALILTLVFSPPRVVTCGNCCLLPQNCCCKQTSLVWPCCYCFYQTTPLFAPWAQKHPICLFCLTFSSIPTPFISTQPHWTRCSGGDVIRTDRNPLTSSNFAKWSRINAQVQICVEALERKDGAINMVWHRC